jgi:hypothetical protein
MIKRILLALAIALTASPALAQSACQYIFPSNQPVILTAGQWNGCFAAKQDGLGFVPMNQAGGTFTGEIFVMPSSATNAGINLAPGVAPSVPRNGDVWVTTAGMYVQIAGVTVGPLQSGTLTFQQLINLNAAAAPPGLTGSGFQLVQANTVPSRMEADAIANVAAWSGVRFDGTLAVPTGVLSGDEITRFDAYAWSSAAAEVGPIGGFRILAAENIASGHQGSKACIQTTPVASTTIADSFCQNASGGVTVGAPTGGDQGAGTINATGLFVNGAPVGAFTAAAGITITSGAISVNNTVLSGPANLSLSASVASNALTVNVLTAAGGTPSAASPVQVQVRDPTVANGDNAMMSITAALSITVPSGQKLGSANTVPFRFWIVLFNSGTVGSPTPALGLVNCSVAGSIFPLQGSAQGVVTTTAIATAPSAGVIYTTSVLTNKPFIIIGYLTYEGGLTTAGTYASAPTNLNLAPTGTPMPGQSTGNVGFLSITAGCTITATSYTACANTSISITPSSKVNAVRFAYSGVQEITNVAATNTSGIMALERGGVTPLGYSEASAFNSSGGLGSTGGFSIVGLDRPSTNTSTTYQIYGQSSSGSANYFINNVNGLVEEIMD